MKIKILTAISLFIVALFSIIDWVVFTTQNDSLKFNEVKAKYIERLPDFLQNFYANNL